MVDYTNIVNYNVYKFSDWTSVNLMKNEKNPRLSAEATYIYNVLKQDELKVCYGVHLTVRDKVTDEMIYGFYIDYNDPDKYSLTQDEAIDLLNLIGFPCKLIPSPQWELNESACKILYELDVAGYSTLIKRVRPNKLFVVIPDCKKSDNLREVSEILTTPYNYYDFRFLPLTPQSIKGLLNHNTNYHH